MTEKCKNCGGKLRSRKYALTTRVGKYRVVDESGVAPQCDECNVVDLPLNVLAGYERRAARTVLRDVQTVDGAVVRFARKALGLRQADFAKLLDVSEQTVSRWENNHEPITVTVKLAIAELLSFTEEYGTEALVTLLEEPEDPPPSLLRVRTA